ncbi:unnamed protein product [Rotaria sordida]|uniref:arabinogalactan endo-beta-1,4-galactanase n=1 Tax=Rotaria sordida TaxID=392033 RepID=A0A819KVL0_9BILA|nr:unnamed protein product [Rotaria sordida]
MQTKPNQWINMTFEQLKQQLYKYTRDTIKSFARQETIPDYVQIGNEVSAGILWPDGNWSDWKKLGSLLRAASKGVRDATQQSKIVVHITHIDTWSTTKWLLDHIVFEENVDFDIIDQRLTGEEEFHNEIMSNYEQAINIWQDYRDDNELNCSYELGQLYKDIIEYYENEIHDQNMTEKNTTT